MPNNLLVSIAWSKPTAFQAVSFERFSTRMRAWPSTVIAGTRCAISNIILCGSPSTVTRFCAAKWRSVPADPIRQICHAREVVIVRGSVSPDHIHMLVSAPAHLAPFKLVQYIKGRSSRRLQEEFPSLRKRYWGQHRWARGYFCATVGAVDEEMIKAYIENQKWDEDDQGFKITAPTEP